MATETNQGLIAMSEWRHNRKNCPYFGKDVPIAELVNVDCMFCEPKDRWDCLLKVRRSRDHTTVITDLAQLGIYEQELTLEKDQSVLTIA